MKNKKQTPDRGARRATLRRLLGLIRPQAPLLALGLLAAAVSVFGQLYIPILTGRAIDCMLGAGRVDFAGIAGLLRQIGIVAAAAALGQWLLGVCNNRVAYGISRGLRDDAIRKIQSLPLSYLDAHPTGDLVSRVIADVDLFPTDC